MNDPRAIGWPNPQTKTPQGWQWPQGLRQSTAEQIKWPSRMDGLWQVAGTFPSLDINFAENKSLVDSFSGRNLITFSRATTGTYVGPDGGIRMAAVNEPRFDHNPTTGESLGLLVEEQRTNLLTWSEVTSQWLLPGTGITISQNQTTAPTEALTADQYIETATTGLHIQDGSAFVFVTGATYTYSVYVKPIGDRNFEIGYPPVVFTGRFARFSLSGSGAVQGTDAGVTASIQAAKDGWYRCSATNTCASGTGARMSNFINNTSFSRSYAGDGTSGIYIWGAQLEAGTFPTSYIPTTGSAVTRSADVAQITGTNFSSWYRQDEGTAYAEFTSAKYGVSGAFFGSFLFYNSAIGNGTGFYHYSQNTGGWLGTGIVRNGWTMQAEMVTSQSISVTLPSKIALAVKADNFGVSANGSSAATDTSGSMPTTVNQLALGTYDLNNFGQMSGRLRRLTYWPTRLSDATLQAITR